MTPVRVLLVGLGPIGVGIGKLLRERSDIRLVAGADVAADKAGQDLGELLGGGPLGITVSPSLRSALETRADVAVLATGSHLEAIASQIRELVEAGCHVVSTSEELAYPWRRHPELAADLDRLARARGVVVAGVGVNPGFAMDLLPIVLTAPCPAVTAVRVERVVDASARRLPLQRKVGIGLTMQEFRFGVVGGTIGHVGLRESAEMIAGALGWVLDDVEETIEPLVAGGTVQGLHQTAVARSGGTPVVTYDLTMAAGVPPRDELWISGPLPLHVEVVGGIHGDVATWSIAASAVRTVPGAAPGLRTPFELPAIHWRRAA
jgi:4-hydroxy-tetrahydrodipicolinate reductase